MSRSRLAVRDRIGGLALGLALLFALPLTAGGQTAPAPPAPAHRDLEANLLVLQVQLDGKVLSDSLDGYVDGRQILLPLGELARLLTLGISVHPQGGSASGFVLREDNEFGLNVGAAVVSLDGQEMTFEARLAQVIGDDIYVSSQLLARWLPIDLDVDLQTLQLRVRPRLRLPLQDRLARQSAGERLNGTPPGLIDPGYPRVKSPYRWVGVPFIDQTFGGQARVGGAASQIDWNYTAYLTGDLLGMEGSAYVSSSHFQPAPDLRLTLGRHDPDARLLGPLRARSLSIGDMALPSVRNVISGGKAGVGVSMSNRPLNQPTAFDRQSLRGSLPPGWDVTLYYNDSLVGYQSSRADGQYAFDDLPLGFGRNEFRLVFNGPLGQLRVERQNFLLDRAIVKPGELFYSMLQHHDDKGGSRSVAQVDVGVTQSLGANAALIRAPGTDADEQRSFTQLGLRAYRESMILSSQVTVAEAGGSLAEFGIKSELGGFAFDFAHTHRFGDFESDSFAVGPGALRYRDAVRLAGLVKAAGLPPLSVTFEADREVRDSGASGLNLGGDASAVLKGTAVSSRLRWSRLNGSVNTTGSLRLSRRMIGIGFNGQMDYTLRPQASMQSLAFTVDRNFAAGYRFTAGLMRDVASRSTLYSAGLSKSLGRFGLALNAIYSSEQELVLGLQVFVALGRDPRTGTWSVDAQPMAGTGAVSARAFVDSNLNGVRDPGEELVHNAGFIFNSGGRHPARTDASGTAFIGRLLPGQYADIALDPATLEDPQWRPVKAGVRVLPRPGRVDEIEFPVVFTTEIDGIVYLTERGRRRGIGDARIELVNAQGLVVAQATSSSDGYYLLHQVLPGHFTLRIAPDQAAERNLEGVLERPMDVRADGDIIGGQDFDLRVRTR